MDTIIIKKILVRGQSEGHSDKLKLYATLRHHKMHPYTRIGTATSENIGDMHQTHCGANGHMPPKVPYIKIIVIVEEHWECENYAVMFGC